MSSFFLIYHNELLGYYEISTKKLCKTQNIRDLAEAIYLLVINENINGFYCHSICSDDITTSGKNSKELVDFIFPGIEWKGDNSYLSEPFKTILNNESIKRLINWKPKYSWKNRK